MKTEEREVKIMEENKVRKVRKQKGDAWWTDEVKEAFEQKKEAYLI